MQKQRFSGFSGLQNVNGILKKNYLHFSKRLRHCVVTGTVLGALDFIGPVITPERSPNLIIRADLSEQFFHDLPLGSHIGGAQTIVLIAEILSHAYQVV